MIEPAAAIGGAPVHVAIAPPGIELFAVGHEASRHVDPVEGRHHAAEQLDLDRRVRHDLEQLLVAPDVVSCRHSTSGLRCRRKRSTFSIRKRMELMFQVATVRLITRYYTARLDEGTAISLFLRSPTEAPPTKAQDHAARRTGKRQYRRPP